MLARDKGAIAPGCDSRREAVTVTVVWIAVGRFAGRLGLASVTDYLRAARGNDRCSTGRRGIDTEAAATGYVRRCARRRCASSRSWKKRWDVRALPLLGRLHATCAAADNLEQATIESLTSNPPPASGAPVCWAMYQAPSSGRPAGKLGCMRAAGEAGPGRDDSMTLVSWLGGTFSGIDLADLRATLRRIRSWTLTTGSLRLRTSRKAF
jgi:hypothetical protein